MFEFRTDLVDERRDLYRKANKIENEVDGIEAEYKKINDKVKITRVRITNDKGEKAIGKKRGNYITIDINKINIISEEEIDDTSKILAEEIKGLIKNKINKQDEILIIGLGNEEVTPDALGPNVVKNIEITRHIIKYLPQYIDKETRSVCAIAPRSTWNYRYRNL